MKSFLQTLFMSMGIFILVACGGSSSKIEKDYSRVWDEAHKAETQRPEAYAKRKLAVEIKWFERNW